MECQWQGISVFTGYLIMGAFNILRHTVEYYLYKDGKHSIGLATNVC